MNKIFSVIVMSLIFCGVSFADPGPVIHIGNQVSWYNCPYATSVNEAFDGIVHPNGAFQSDTLYTKGFTYEDENIEKVLPYIHMVGGFTYESYTPPEKITDFIGMETEEAALYYDRINDIRYSTPQWIGDKINISDISRQQAWYYGNIIPEWWSTRMLSWVGSSNKEKLYDKYSYNYTYNKDISSTYGPDPTQEQIDFYNGHSNPNFVWILYADSSLEEEINAINEISIVPRIYVYKYVDNEPVFTFLD